MPHKDPLKAKECRKRYYQRNAVKIQAWREAHRHEANVTRRRYYYGISEKQYRELFAEQGNRCAICGVSFDRKTPCIDHCHTTGKVRGLLCTGCNTRAGHMESPLAKKTQRYLRKHKK